MALLWHAVTRIEEEALAISWLVWPSAAMSTIRARRTRLCGVRGVRTQRVSRLRCSSVIADTAPARILSSSRRAGVRGAEPADIVHEPYDAAGGEHQGHYQETRSDVGSHRVGERGSK